MPACPSRIPLRNRDRHADLPRLMPETGGGGGGGGGSLGRGGADGRGEDGRGEGGVEPCLAGADLFASLASAEDRAWSARCLRHRVTAGTLLSEDGSPDRSLFFSRQGHLRSSLGLGPGKRLFLGEFGPGQVARLIAGLDGLPQAGCLVARTDAEVVQVPAAVLGEILACHHDIALALNRLLAGRMRIMVERMFELSSLDARHRLYNALLRLSVSTAEPSGQRVIAPPMIHAEIAEHIGATRETVSREMSRLTADAVLERRSDALVIRRPRELQRRLAQVDRPGRGDR